LLIAILVLLYVLGDMLGLTSLLIILIFGIVLNNRDLFFKGRLSALIDSEKTDSVLDDFKVITAESAFVVRTFFFIIFGWSISLLSLVYNKANGEWTFKVFVIGFFLLLTIYLVRFLVLLVFVRKSVWPQVFLSPRGLLTILLFYAIPTNITPETSFDFEGVLLFIILASCLIMSWALIKNRKKEEKTGIQPVVETKKTPLEDKEGKNDKTGLEDDYNN
jgi:cell volume regulation protein A